MAVVSLSGCSAGTGNPAQTVIKVKSKSILRESNPYIHDGVSHGVICPGDLDGDDVTDLIIACGPGEGKYYPLGMITAFSGATAEPIWETVADFRKPDRVFEARLSNIALVHDADHDGFADVLAMTESSQPVAYVISSGNGAVIDHHKFLERIPRLVRPLSTSDLDGNSNSDLAFGVIDRESKLRVHVAPQGDLAKLQDPVAVWPTRFSQSWALAEFADENGDGVKDHLARQGLSQNFDDEVYQYEMGIVDGKRFEILRTFRTDRPRTTSASECYASMGDINGDGSRDIAMVSNVGATSDRRVSFLRVFSGLDGQILWEISGSQIEGAQMQLVGKGKSESFSDCRFGNSLISLPDRDGDSIRDIATVIQVRTDDRGAKPQLVVFSGSGGQLLANIEPRRGVIFYQNPTMVFLPRANRRGDPGVGIVSRTDEKYSRAAVTVVAIGMLK